jgi:hypothetical protein
MRIEVIPVSELDTYMKLHKKEMELRVTMTHYLEDQKLQLKRLERIKELASFLSRYKSIYETWFNNLPYDMKKELNKYRW